MDARLVAALRFLDRESADEADAIRLAKARALLYGYHARWHDSHLRVTAVEEVAIGPLRNPATGKDSPVFATAGKLDLRAIDGGHPVIIDHKTTSESIEDLTSDYWSQVQVEGQFLHYMMLEKFAGRRVRYVLIDAIRRPEKRQRQITKAEMTKLRFDGVWFGSPVPEKSLAYALEQEREDVVLYEARMIEDTITRPEFYFQRKPYYWSESDLIEYQAELWSDARDLREDRKREVHTRNSRTCLSGGTCQFLGVCGHKDFEPPTDDSPLWSERWARRENVHVELPGIVGGKNLLTNSRMVTFRSCHRKHQYLYNIGIERAQPTEVMAFGSLVHEALAEYFKEEMRMEKGELDEHYSGTAEADAKRTNDGSRADRIAAVNDRPDPKDHEERRQASDSGSDPRVAGSGQDESGSTAGKCGLFTGVL